MTRRQILNYLVQGSGLLVAGVVAVPSLVLALSPALRRRPGSSWLPLGRFDDFPEDEVTLVNLEVPDVRWTGLPGEKGVYVWRRSDDEVVVFSRNCTDLSCPVVYDAGSTCFFCPCHGGIFAKNGDPMAGPPPRPLYRYATRLRNQVVEIDLHSLPPMT